MEQGASNPSQSRNLQRGRACVNCRRRKMRCDGVRPICGQCDRANRPDDCEYTDGQGRSRTQILEENISRLETRIHELENPAEPTTSVMLHQPYVQPGRRGAPPSGSSRQYSTSYGQSSASSSSRSSGSMSGGPSSGSSPWASQEPPMNVVQILVDNFLPYSSEFGFFLNVSRFRESALLNLPYGHHSRPSPAVLSSVYLWGIHLSGSSSFMAHENAVLSRALQQTANALSGTHPHRVIHGYQAEVLLAYYFFSNGRFLEGQYHVAAAISLAVSSALHKIRSAQSTPTVGNAISPLQRPRDAIEEGERINGCWVGIILDKCWAVALGATPNLVDPTDTVGAQVDTPWPLEMREYEQGQMPSNISTSFTVQKFLNGAPTRDVGVSTQATHAKASILWQRAYDLSVQWRPNMTRQETHTFRTAFSNLDNLIDRTRNSLMPVDQIANPTTAMIRTLVVAHSLVHAATMQLHNVFGQENEHAKNKSLSAARAVLAIVGSPSLRNFTYINPIMGTLWVTACQVFIDEISTLRSQRPAWAPNAPVQAEQELVSAFERGLSAMTTFSATGPVIRYQVMKIQEAYSSI